jgi:AraC-like DNA-binding protein
MRVFHLKNFDRDFGRISVERQHFAPGGGTEAHRHDCVEVMYILSGSGVNEIDGIPYPVIAGDIYLINRGVTHAFRATGGLDFYNLMFQFSIFSAGERRMLQSIDGFDRFFHPPSGQATGRGNPYVCKIFPSPRFTARIRSVFDELRAVGTEDGAFALLKRKAWLILLLDEMFENDKVPLATGRRPSAAEPDALPRILEYLHAYFTRPIAVDDVAAAACLSPAYVGQFFRARTGVPLVRYIQTLRVEMARGLLETGSDCRVTEIAGRCGFEDDSYFARIFRRLTGFTPTAYRTLFGTVSRRG